MVWLHCLPLSMERVRLPYYPAAITTTNAVVAAWPIKTNPDFMDLLAKLPAAAAAAAPAMVAVCTTTRSSRDAIPQRHGNYPK